MRIEKFGGTEARLYQLVAPLVMNPAILRQNNNYPFKTSAHYVWFVALEGERILGFVPIEIREKVLSSIIIILLGMIMKYWPLCCRRSFVILLRNISCSLLLISVI